MNLADLKHFFTSLRGGSTPPQWDDGHIRDAWFEAHFHYATDVVADWVGLDRLRSGRTLDFGCGDGITGLGLILRHGARSVLGIDVSATHRGLPKLAQREIGLRRLPANLQFQRITPGQPFKPAHQADVIMSWSTFEHIEWPYMAGVLDNLHQVLADDGVFFLQINPLFYSPQGSHLGRFQLPAWAHLLMTPDELLQAVAAFSGDIPEDEVEENFHKRDFATYKEFVLDEYRKLNKLTTSQLIAQLQLHGFEVVREHFGQVSQMPPPALLAAHTEHDLRTEEVRLLIRKRAGG